MVYKLLKVSIVAALANGTIYAASIIYINYLKAGIKNKEAALGAALEPYNLIIFYIMRLSSLVLALTATLIVVLGSICVNRAKRTHSRRQ